MRLLFPVDVNRRAKLNFLSALVSHPVRRGPKPDIYQHQNDDNSNLSRHFSDKDEKKKNDKKKTITARLLSVSSVQEDGYISEQSQN